ncbi:MAG: hypothetical protein IPK16_30015 [Anaerolineales bacterium]|nr:hypothetical protein [Anaerolineales bacterium]
MVGEGYFTWQQLIQDFCSLRHQGMQPVYHDERWADLAGLATITDRVIKMVDENNNYWTPYLEITRLSAQLRLLHRHPRKWRRMRLRPVEEVVEIKRRNIKRFFLTDDNFGLNFTTDPEYCAELFEALMKLDLHGWTCQSEMSIAKHPDLLEMSVAAHLDKHFVGLKASTQTTAVHWAANPRPRRPDHRSNPRDPRHRCGVVGAVRDGFRRRHARDIPGHMGLHSQQ